MARRSNPGRKDLMPLLIVGGALFAGASGLLGATVKSGLSQLGADIKGTFGGQSVSAGGVTVSTQSATAGTGHDIGGQAVYTAGTATTILNAARAAGVTNASGGNAAKFGSALWSLQSGQPQSAFYQQPADIQATFSSVAVTGS